MRARIDGSWREITSGRVRVGGAWKELSSIKVCVGGDWKDAKSFFPPFVSLDISPSPVVNTRVGGAVRQSSVVTATPSGGTPPFSYAWSYVSGDLGYTITSPSSASTTFSIFVINDVTYQAIFECVATDALGVSWADTVSVSITGADIGGLE